MAARVLLFTSSGIPGHESCAWQQVRCWPCERVWVVAAGCKAPPAVPACLLLSVHPWVFLLSPLPITCRAGSGWWCLARWPGWLLRRWRCCGHVPLAPPCQRWWVLHVHAASYMAALREDTAESCTLPAPGCNRKAFRIALTFNPAVSPLLLPTPRFPCAGAAGSVDHLHHAPVQQLSRASLQPERRWCPCVSLADGPRHRVLRGRWAQAGGVAEVGLMGAGHKWSHLVPKPICPLIHSDAFQCRHSDWLHFQRDPAGHPWLPHPG